MHGHFALFACGVLIKITFNANYNVKFKKEKVYFGVIMHTRIGGILT